MNNYDDLFKGNTSKESLEDKRTEQKLDDLERIFIHSVDRDIFEDTSELGSIDDFYNRHSENKSSFGLSDGIQKSESSIDSLEKTAEIGDVDLETLRNYSKMLHEQMDEPKEAQSSSQANSNAKVLVKRTGQATVYPGANESSFSEDMSQILQAFISCSILSFVTAGIGVGWLLYIIMHI